MSRKMSRQTKQSQRMKADPYSRRPRRQQPQPVFHCYHQTYMRLNGGKLFKCLGCGIEIHAMARFFEFCESYMERAKELDRRAMKVYQGVRQGNGGLTIKGMDFIRFKHLLNVEIDPKVNAQVVGKRTMNVVKVPVTIIN
jgi:hypothetical protein